MEAYDRFNRCIFEWERMLLKLIGHDFFDGKKFELNFMSFIVYGVVCSITVCVIYTTIYYDLLSKIFAFMTFIIVVQGVIKLAHVQYVDDFQWITFTVQGFYKMHIKSKSTDRIAFFNKFAFFTETVFKVMVFLYVLSVFTFVPYPIYMYWFENEVVTMLPVYMPGIDEKSFLGYILLTGYQFFTVLVATLGICACDFFMAMAIMSTLIFAELFSMEMEQIGADLDSNEPLLIIQGRFKNLLLMHQEMLTYMKRVEKLAFYMFFGQVGSSSLGSVVVLYLILMFRYVPVYGMILVLLFQIFIACLLGNFIELTHDKIYEAVLKLNYNDLPKAERMMYRFFVTNCQNPALLTIGGLAPLNLATCVTIFSRIYSITMIIFTMVEA